MSSMPRMPGMPAVTNKRAIELGIAAGLVTNSEITKTISFDKRITFILTCLQDTKLPNYSHQFVKMDGLRLKQKKVKRKSP